MPGCSHAEFTSRMAGENGPGRSGGIPPAVKPWAPETSVSEARWIVNRIQPSGAFLFFRVPSVFGAIAMPAGAVGAAVREAVADSFPQLPEPAPRPREFDREYRKAHRNENERRSRGYDHDDTQQHDRAADDSNRNAACCLVRQVNCLLNHWVIPNCAPALQLVVIIFFMTTIS